MSVRARRIEKDFLKVDGKFESMMTQFTTLTEKPGAKTTSKRYIGDASTRNTITSYEPSSDFEADQIESDKVIEYMANIGKMRLTGADTETELLQVEVDRPGKADNTYYARKSLVAVQVDEFGDNDGEFTMSGSINYLGDPVEVTVELDDKNQVVGVTEGFEDKTLEFAYVATGAVTDINVDGITYNSSEHKFKNIPAKVKTFTFKDGSNPKTATLKETWVVA